MKPLASVLLASAVLVGLGSATAEAKGGRCLPGCWYGDTCTPEGCPPYWCDPYACLHPWPYDNPLITGPRNWSWMFPDGGFTVYPGEPGSGIQAGSDYSHVNWVQPPQANAAQVVQKLDLLGIPRVPQDTIFLGKNPAQIDKAKLPLPRIWGPREAEKEIEKGKDGDK